MTTAHDFTFASIDGNDIALKDYQGKAVLVVNTASQCGFTGQYADLEKIWDEYTDKGLVVLGVPSNDFSGQEPGSDQEIAKFTQEKYDVSFPMTSKATVKGSDAHPFYEWANQQTSFLGTPKWNFHKFLIGPDGKLLEWFSSTTSPTSNKVRKAIDEALAGS